VNRGDNGSRPRTAGRAGRVTSSLFTVAGRRIWGQHTKRGGSECRQGHVFIIDSAEKVPFWSCLPSLSAPKTRVVWLFSRVFQPNPLFIIAGRRIWGQYTGRGGSGEWGDVWAAPAFRMSRASGLCAGFPEAVHGREQEETGHRRKGIVGTEGDGFENLAGGIRWWAVSSSFHPLPGIVRGEGYRSLP
jgi:hypothetical protein